MFPRWKDRPSPGSRSPPNRVPAAPAASCPARPRHPGLPPESSPARGTGRQTAPPPPAKTRQTPAPSQSAAPRPHQQQEGNYRQQEGSCHSERSEESPHFAFAPAHPPRPAGSLFGCHSAALLGCHSAAKRRNLLCHPYWHPPLGCHSAAKRRNLLLQPRKPASLPLPPAHPVPRTSVQSE